mgnify:CR=1 FL=1
MNTSTSIENIFQLMYLLILSITAIFLLPKILKYCLDRKELNNRFTIKNESERKQLLEAKNRYDQKFIIMRDSKDKIQEQKEILKYLIDKTDDETLKQDLMKQLKELIK